MWPCLPIKQMPFGGRSSADVSSSAWVLQRQAILLRSDGLLKDLVSKTPSACLQGVCRSYGCRLGGNLK